MIGTVECNTSFGISYVYLTMLQKYFSRTGTLTNKSKSKVKDVSEIILDILPVYAYPEIHCLLRSEVVVLLECSEIFASLRS